MDKFLEQKCKQLGIGSVTRHMFLCGGPKCCDAATGDKLWEFLKRRLRELNLVDTQVYRTRVTCLRICASGPIGLVYPEGTWYANLDENKCERIIQDHLIQGKPVTEYAFAHSELFDKFS